MVSGNPGLPFQRPENWELYTHVITDDEKVDLKKLPSAKGIWAPCLTYCEEEDMFYVVYGVMNSMNARYFDVDNFLICAKDIRGPWSEPVYLHPPVLMRHFSMTPMAKIRGIPGVGNKRRTMRSQVLSVW